MKAFKPEEIIQALNTILNIEPRLSGFKYLQQIVKNTAVTLESRYAFVGHVVPPENDRVRTDVIWSNGEYAENLTYLLAGTPCENVYSSGRVCVHKSRVAEQFPLDTLLAEMEVQSYIGAPLFTEDGDLSGILVILDDKPVEDETFFVAIMEFLALRVGAELSRHYIEERLKRLVAERTTELEETNKKLQQAISEIKTLQGILPICSKCKKIRDDQGFWQQVESYISRHSQATFSHSICPECMDEFYRELKTGK